MLRLLTSIMLASALALGVAHADIVRVNVEGTGPYPTIQHGINAAAQGDTVLIGPGLYHWGNQNTDQWPAGFRGMIQLLNEGAEHQGDPRADTANDIFIIGEEGRGQTIIDAQRNGRVFYASGRQQGDDNVAMRFTVEGITLQGGFAQGPIETNRWGGGSATHLSSPIFRNCRFRDNEAELGGGGAWTGGQNKALFENCVFIDNTAAYGAGALAINSSRNNSIWRDCRFEGNEATEIAGGIYVINAQVEIDRCTFIDNFGRIKASAIATNIARPLIIRDCFIVGNQGADAALWARYAIDPDYDGDPVPSTTNIEIYNTLVASNSRIGIQFDADVDPTVHCTNSFGHPGGNWWNRAAGLRTVNGNGSFDPHLCGTSLRLRQVCELSPTLAMNNFECATDMGLTVSGCSGCEISDYFPTNFATQNFPAYPNPFRDQTTMEYDLAKRARVRITIYDLRGRIVRNLLDKTVDAGSHQAEWDGCDDSGDAVASGVYLCEFSAGQRQSRTPMLLLH